MSINQPVGRPKRQRRPARVLCVMDLSVVGRASLSVVSPVLAACGVQACILPAALFSSHTGGFGSVHKQDESAFGFAALEQYRREEVLFDAVYIGYLYGEAQFRLAQAAIEQYPTAMHIVDPALGDGGAPYSGITPATINLMRGLCQSARLITPNFTESALLCNQPPENTPLPANELRQRLAQLSDSRCSVLVTSVPTAEGGYSISGCGPGVVQPFSIPTQHFPQHYPGTGDLFCAAVVGLMLGQHCSLQQAARRAAAFVEESVRATYENGGTPRSGLWFEPQLPMLHHIEAAT